MLVQLKMVKWHENKYKLIRLNILGRTIKSISGRQQERRLWKTMSHFKGRGAILSTPGFCGNGALGDSWPKCFCRKHWIPVDAIDSVEWGVQE